LQFIVFLNLAIVCDEGSNLVRLLGRIGNDETENFNELEEIEIEEENDEEENHNYNIDSGITSVEEQLNGMEIEIKSFTYSKYFVYSHSNDYSNSTLEKVADVVELNDDEIYDLSNGNEVNKDLKIELGSSELQRFSCACHKFDTVTKHAFKNHGFILKLLKELSTANSKIRNCLESNRIFRDLKCKPKVDQKTRWLSGIRILLSNKRAYDKGAYNEVTVCPTSLEELEMYIQVLKPGMEFTLGMQKYRSSIADVLPSVLRLISVWDKMELESRIGKELCYFMIIFLRKKFKYELDSPVYQVQKLF
jgi:hypothetical protein